MTATAPPDPPLNVRLIDTTGQEWPVQLTYAGTHQGLDTWDVVDTPHGRSFDRILVETLPARSAIRMPITTPSDQDEAEA